MPRWLSRLRWQLTLSHLAAILFTLVSMVAALMLIASSWWSSQNAPSRQPAQAAGLVAQAAGGMIRNGSANDVNIVLRGLADGSLRATSASWGPPGTREGPPVGSAESPLGDTAYIVAVNSDGAVIGSSDASGASFSPPEVAEWRPLIGRAMAGASGDLVALRTGAGPEALGAAAVVDDEGHAVAAVLVGVRSLPIGEHGFLQTLVAVGTATAVVLAGSLIFALASSSLVGYLLARRLVRRLERLGRATESFAAGDLSQRAEPGSSADEVGQLERRFNAMADRLQDSLVELEAAKQRAETALDAKRELVANVSHELRTPLASIRGHTESLLICEPREHDRIRTYSDIIHRQSEQLSRLIDDLFLLSTAESGALPLGLRSVALGEVVDDVVDSIRLAARSERQVSIVTKVEPDLLPVLADRQRVAQVLANLVRNAVRYTPEGGLVAVRARRLDDRFAVVSVEDTGEGIPPDQLEHVFERFYRAEPSRDRTSGGAGLGLAIVRELVIAMGGQVSVESVVGQGTQFSFTLPLVTGVSHNHVTDPRFANDRLVTVKHEAV